MKNTVLDKWCIPQSNPVKRYCHICGIYISEKDTQSREGEQYFCPKHRGLGYPNVLLMDGRLFKTVFKTVEKILQRDNADELTIQVSKEGIHFRYMDPSHISLTEIQLYPKAFKALNINFPTPKTFTIDLNKLRKILRTAEKNDEAQIRFNEENIQLSLLRKNYTHDKNAQQMFFSLKLLENPTEDIPEPELNFQALISVKASALIQALKRIRKLANYQNTYFKCNPNHLQIYAHDENNNKISQSFSKFKLLKIQTETEVSSTYNSDYILTLIDGLKPYINETQIQYSKNTPILLIANLSSTKHTKDQNSYLGHIKAYLAPLIPENEWND